MQWEDRCGWKLKTEERRLRLHGIGEVKVHLHREVRGTPKAITVTREGRHWWVSIRCVDVPATRLPKSCREVGVDVGVVNLVTTSDGLVVSGERFARRAQDRLAAAQRELSGKQRGSSSRRRAVERVARHHRSVRNQRRDFAHKLSRTLVNDYDRIVLEDLRIASMVRRPRPRPGPEGVFEPNGAAAKSGLNRSIQDAGWGQLVSMLAYKAEDAGRELVMVDPRFTSQRCASCGHTDKGNRLSQARFRCLVCGHRDHADLNAAKNVLWAGRAQRAFARAG